MAAVNQLKAHIDTVQDPRQRAALDQALRRLELQVGRDLPGDRRPQHHRKRRDDPEQHRNGGGLL